MLVREHSGKVSKKFIGNMFFFWLWNEGGASVLKGQGCLLSYLGVQTRVFSLPLGNQPNPDWSLSEV